jgi:hypothetical protein
MTQKSVTSNGPSVGRFKNVDDNFTELYAGAASANTALTSLLASQSTHEAAWTTYSATATAAVGTLTTTTTAARLYIGKTVHFSAQLVISATSSSASGELMFNLPATANRAASFVGRDITNKWSVAWHVAAGSITATGANYDATTACRIATHYVSGVYEKQ